jgi:hypothetical protein
VIFKTAGAYLQKGKGKTLLTRDWADLGRSSRIGRLTRPWTALWTRSTGAQCTGHLKRRGTRSGPSILDLAVLVACKRARGDGRPRTTGSRRRRAENSSEHRRKRHSRARGNGLGCGRALRGAEVTANLSRWSRRWLRRPWWLATEGGSGGHSGEEAQKG